MVKSVQKMLATLWQITEILYYFLSSAVIS